MNLLVFVRGGGGPRLVFSETFAQSVSRIAKNSLRDGFSSLGRSSDVPRKGAMLSCGYLEVEFQYREEMSMVDIHVECARNQIIPTHINNKIHSPDDNSIKAGPQKLSF